MARRLIAPTLVLLAAGCTPEPALVPPPAELHLSWVLPPPPPAPVPVTPEERRLLEAEWPPVWFAPEPPPPEERRVVTPRVRIIHPPLGMAPGRARVLQARGRPEVVVLRADGRCQVELPPAPCEARPTLRPVRVGGGCEPAGAWAGPTPTPPGR